MHDFIANTVFLGAMPTVSMMMLTWQMDGLLPLMEPGFAMERFAAAARFYERLCYTDPFLSCCNDATAVRAAVMCRLKDNVLLRLAAQLLLESELSLSLSPVPAAVCVHGAHLVLAPMHSSKVCLIIVSRMRDDVHAKVLEACVDDSPAQLDDLAFHLATLRKHAQHKRRQHGVQRVQPPGFSR